MAGEANGSLIAGAVIDGARRERRQRRPIPAVDWQIVDLGLLDGGADGRVHLVELHQRFRDGGLLFPVRYFQLGV